MRPSPWIQELTTAIAALSRSGTTAAVPCTATELLLALHQVLFPTLPVSQGSGFQGPETCQPSLSEACEDLGVFPNSGAYFTQLLRDYSKSRFIVRVEGFSWASSLVQDITLVKKIQISLLDLVALLGVGSPLPDQLELNLSIGLRGDGSVIAADRVKQD